MPRSRVPDPLVPAPQVEQLLVAEPENAEYVELKAGLVEVIAMTEDLVDGHPDAKANEAGAEAEGNEADVSIIDESVAGALCRVRADGATSEWLDAVMVAVLADGRIRVVVTKGDEDVVADVAPEDVRDAAGERNGDESARPREVYQGVPAPKRLRVTENSAFSKRAVPEKFKVVDGDDEATRERKRKQAKAFKGKQRMLEKDAEQTAKRNDWQSFQAKVGGKKKTGFITKKLGSKKGSMFGTKD